MIGHVAARAHQRAVALADIPIERDVVEEYARSRDAVHSILVEGGPAFVGGAFHLAIGFGVLRPAASSRYRGVEMLLIPELRAERIVLVHVDVIETLGGHVALVFDGGPVRSETRGEA